MENAPIINNTDDSQYKLNLDKVELFKGKTYEALLSDIYTSQSKTDRVLDSTIQQLKSLISNNAPLRDIALILPMIKDFVSLSVKNQDSLVKMASIVEKIVNDHRINLNNQRALSLKESNNNQFKSEKSRVTLSNGKRRDNNNLSQTEIAEDDALQLSEDEKRQLLETMEEAHQSLMSTEMTNDDIKEKINNIKIDTDINIDI